MYHILGINSSTRIAAAEAGVLSRQGAYGGALLRRGVLTRVDRELDKGKYKEAISLVKQLQRQPGGLRGFGAIKLVPNKMLELNGLENREVSSASSPGHPSLIHRVMHSIECCRRFAIEEHQGLASAMVNSVDNESGNSASEDHFMCLQHEAGHFLVGYLLGQLPKQYRIPSVQDLMEERFAGGMVEFPGFEFLSEIDVADTLNKNRKKTKGKLSNETLNRFLCVILAGLVAEHLLFGYSEMLHSDVNKMDNVLKWLNFTEEEAYYRVRYAALNTIIILRTHDLARSKLAEAMVCQRSISFCIHTIENTLK